jgi:hypothetical protein
MLARRDTRIEASRVRRVSPLQAIEDQSPAWGIRCHSCTWREGLTPSWKTELQSFWLCDLPENRSPLSINGSHLHGWGIPPTREGSPSVVPPCVAHRRMDGRSAAAAGDPPTPRFERGRPHGKRPQPSASAACEPAPSWWRRGTCHGPRNSRPELMCWGMRRPPRATASGAVPPREPGLRTLQSDAPTG